MSKVRRKCVFKNLDVIHLWPHKDVKKCLLPFVIKIRIMTMTMIISFILIVGYKKRISPPPPQKKTLPSPEYQILNDLWFHNFPLDSRKSSVLLFIHSYSCCFSFCIKESYRYTMKRKIMFLEEGKTVIMAQFLPCTNNSESFIKWQSFLIFLFFLN